MSDPKPGPPLPDPAVTAIQEQVMSELRKIAVDDRPDAPIYHYSAALAIYTKKLTVKDGGKRDVWPAIRAGFGEHANSLYTYAAHEDQQSDVLAFARKLDGDSKQDETDFKSRAKKAEAQVVDLTAKNEGLTAALKNAEARVGVLEARVKELEAAAKAVPVTGDGKPGGGR